MSKHSVYTLADLFSPQKAKQALVASQGEKLQTRQRFFLHFCLLPFEGKNAQRFAHTGKFKIMNIVSTSHTLD